MNRIAGEYITISCYSYHPAQGWTCTASATHTGPYQKRIFFMAKGISPTARTLEYLRSQGWSADIVERFLHKAGPSGIRKDLFGIIDIVALTDQGIMGVQSCGQAFADHDKKILSNPMALKWIEKGGVLMLIGWRKVKLKRGGKAMRWAPRIKYYGVRDFKDELDFLY